MKPGGGLKFRLSGVVVFPLPLPAGQRCSCVLQLLDFLSSSLVHRVAEQLAHLV